MRRNTLILLGSVIAAACHCAQAPVIHAADAPIIIRASDPVRPDETVLLYGGFGKGAVVEVARLDDAAVTAPTDPDGPLARKWEKVQPLQAGECSIKFVMPRSWRMGVFACRAVTGGATSNMVLINAPDPWWVQGDAGESAGRQRAAALSRR